MTGLIITVMMFTALAFYLTWDAYKKHPELEKLKKPLIGVSVLRGLVMLINCGILFMNFIL